MKIKICSGTGENSTREGAFDKALWEAGVANYNLPGLLEETVTRWFDYSDE